MLLLLPWLLVAGALVISQEPFEEAADDDGAVVIVEPRAHPNFRYVLELFRDRVPASWSLYVFHGSTNGAAARAAADGWVRTGRKVEFHDLGVDNLNAAQYNALFKSVKFWEMMQEEDLLIVQTDAVPCSSSPYPLSKFRKFPYIGCAYTGQVGRDTYWEQYGFFGSGGLSFRKRSFALRCAKAYPPLHAPEAEDVTFGECVAEFGAPKPTARDLSEFCTQNSFLAPSWGAHQVAQQLPADQKPAFRGYCPESARI